MVEMRVRFPSPAQVAQNMHNNNDIIYANGKLIPRLKKKKDGTYREDTTREHKTQLDKIIILWVLGPKILLPIIIVSLIIAIIILILTTDAA